MKKMIVGLMLAIGLVSGAVAGDELIYRKNEYTSDNTAYIVDKMVEGRIGVRSLMNNKESGILICIKIKSMCERSIALNAVELRAFAAGINEAVRQMEENELLNKK